jgi:hypothetical protein
MLPSFFCTKSTGFAHQIYGFCTPNLRVLHTKSTGFAHQNFEESSSQNMGCSEVQILGKANVRLVSNR